MRKRTVTIAAGLGLSLVLLVYVVGRIEWESFWSALAAMQFVWLLPVLGGALLSTFLRTFRWRFIAGKHAARLGPYWQACCIGYLGNFIYPLRAGEVIRMVALSRLAGISGARALTSAVMDRVVDAVGLGVALMLVLGVHGLGIKGSGDTAVYAVVLLAGLAAALVLFVAFGDRAQGLVERAGHRLPAILRQRLPAWYHDAVEVARQFRSVSRSAFLVSLQALILTVDYVSIWFLFSAFGWDLPLMAAVTAGVFIQAGAMLPSAPGALGIHQLASILALGLYGIDEGGAFAFSIVQELLFLALFAVLGGWASVHFGISMSKAARESGSDST